MYLNTKALVLRVIDYNDRDCLLSLLTMEQGRITAKARGLRRKNSPMTAACQLMAFSDFCLFEYQGRYTVDEATVIEMFSEMRKDLEKVALGTYFVQVLDVASQSDESTQELLSLALNCLYALSVWCLPENLVKAVFELRVACISGFMPDLSCCHVCGSEYPSYLDLLNGNMLCERCLSGGTGIRMPLGPGELDAMRYVSYCEPKKIFSFYLCPESLERLTSVTEAYLATQFERGFDALDFYKSLLTTGE